jgi:flagellar L-ring protein FlgH
MSSFKNSRATLALLSFLLVTLFATDLHAQTQSLWDRRDQRKAFLFRDLKARSIGDILTIAITENSDVENSDSRGLSKQSSSSANGGFGYSGVSSGSAAAEINSDSQRDFSGDVNFSSARQFQDRFSVTVIDILPNGNLVVSGSRNVLVEGDEKTLTVTGIVRGDDILSDNSVRSSSVANLDINLTGKGTEQDFVKQGWLGRKVNKLWPF